MFNEEVLHGRFVSKIIGKLKNGKEKAVKEWKGMSKGKIKKFSCSVLHFPVK